MKFALLNNIKVEATKGANGICPVCNSEVIAKCGQVKINHWSHKRTKECDPWWENETDWHRSWKNHFPTDWQEVILLDGQTGEKHIADIRTAHGLVIEFQHSHIDPNERSMRERFYKSMIWLVDGTRLKRDYSRFLKGKNDLRRTNIQGYFFSAFPDKCFPSAWLDSAVPVIFDFRGTELISDSSDLRNHLYCLFPKGNKQESLLAIISRESFITSAISGELFKVQEQKDDVTKPIKQTVVIRRPEPTHYLNPRTGRFVKRRRF